MEDLYRRVSDRQTMGSVVQELRASLSEMKNTSTSSSAIRHSEVLIQVPGQLSSMRGVLSVLGQDHASHAVVRMRDDVDTLIAADAGDTGPHQAAFERLADNLGALSFLIDMLSVQPQIAKSLFRFDASNGNLMSVMDRAHRPSVFGSFDELPAPDQGLVDRRMRSPSRRRPARTPATWRVNSSAWRGRPRPPTTAALPARPTRRDAPSQSDFGRRAAIRLLLIFRLAGFSALALPSGTRAAFSDPLHDCTAHNWDRIEIAAFGYSRGCSDNSGSLIATGTRDYAPYYRRRAV